MMRWSSAVRFSLLRNSKHTGPRSVQRPKRTLEVEALEMRLAPAVLIPVTNHRDLVFDSTRQLLYITCSDGKIQRYDIVHQTLLTPWTVGTSLNGADISPDGSSLYVGENYQFGAADLYKVNLNDGTVKDLNYPYFSGQYGVWDVAISSNGTGLVTSTGTSAGYLHQLTLATDTLTNRTDEPGGPQIGAQYQVHVGGDRSLLFLTGPGSNGPYFTYSAATDKFPASGNSNDYQFNMLSAVSRDGSLIAMEPSDDSSQVGVTIRDRNLNVVTSVISDIGSGYGLYGGVAFDPNNNVFYAADNYNNQIYAFDTTTWNLLYRLNIGETIPHAQVLGNGEMTVSPDSHWLFLATPSGVRMFDLTAQPSFSINDVQTNVGDVAKFTVTMSKSSSLTPTVNYATADGTAIANQNYQAVSGTVAIPPSNHDMTTTISVPSFRTSLPGPTTAFTVNLSNPVNAQIDKGQGTDTISNSDYAQMTINNDIAVVENGPSSVNAVFTVCLNNGPLNQTYTVNYATSDSNGRAGVDYTATSGTLTFAPGVRSQTITVPVLGGVTHTTDTYFFVKLTGGTGSYSLPQPNGRCDIVANSPSAGLPTLSINSISAPEPNAFETNVNFTVSLSAASSQTVTVQAEVVDQTATLSFDYFITPSTAAILTFAPGVTSQTFTLQVMGEARHEPNDTFLVCLSQATNAVIAVSQGVGTILVNNPAALSINDVRVKEASSGTTNAVFTVTLDQPSDDQITVNYATADGTGTAGTDYTATSGTLIFSPGQAASETITVPILGTATGDGNKTFTVTLSGAVNSSITRATGTATIEDTPPPALGGTNVAVQEGTSGTTNAVFAVTLPSASSQTTVVQYATADGTATAGVDYQATSGTLTFAPGEVSKTVSVPVYGDTVYEPDETFYLNLTNVTPGGASLVADIAPGPTDSNPGPFIVYNNALYFSANDGVHGPELWKYDGTTLSVAVAMPLDTANAAIYNGLLYMGGTDATHGAQLWKFDGTTASLAAVINPSGSAVPTDPMVYNGKLYFTADDGVHGRELWSFDGTNAALVTDLNPGSASSYAAPLGVVNNQLVLSATTPATGFELWKYDGTTVSLVDDIFPGTGDSWPSNPAIFNGALYFTAWTYYNGPVVLKYDGTSVTHVADIWPTPYVWPQSLRVVNGVLYYQATDESHGSEPWSFNGTTGSLLYDLSPGILGSSPSQFIGLNGNLYFTANAANAGTELWKYDGTDFTLAADIYPGPLSSSPQYLTVFNNALYFAANDGVHGNELWTYTDPSPFANSQLVGTVQDTNTTGATSLAVSGFPSPTTAGVAGSVTVTAEDSNGHVVTGYTGTVHFTSSDSQAVLPADYAFTSADAGVHTFSATLKTAGGQSLTATDTASSTITGSQTGVTVNPAAANSLAVTGFPSPATAGVAGTVTITAKDPYGNTATGYTGTVGFTSSDAQAALPANYTFAAADAGVHAFSATLKTAGSQSLTATDTATSTITGSQTGITVNPAAADHLVFGVQPSNTIAGAAISPAVIVQIYDRFNNLVTSDNSDSVTMAIGTNPNSGTLSGTTIVTASSGVATFSNLSINKAGSGYTLSASSGSLAGASSTSFTISPAAASTFSVTGFPSPVISGQAQNFRVTALDPFGNTATGYAGTVHFTSTDAAAVLPANYAFQSSDAGVHTFSATLETAGTQSLTATDAATASITGTEAGILVKPASFVVNGFPSPTNAGAAHTFSITAENANGTTATGYTGSVHFTSSDSQAVLPSDSTLTNGTGSFSATLKTAGSQSITATDTVTSTITGTQSGITVNPLVASVLVVAGFPSPATAGVAGSFTVTARDTYGNTATGYRGIVKFSSTDTKAALPANYTFTSTDNGVHTFSATLKTAATQSITATDTVTATIKGTQSGITVNPAATNSFNVTGFPSPIVAGTAGSFTVTALDAFGNLTPGYRGTVKFNSSDGKAVLPANYTFVAADNGVHSFTATLKTAGTRSIQATDTVTSSIHGQQTGIVVNPAATSLLAVTGFPTQPVAGTAGTFTVMAQDTYGNKTPSYLGTVHFTSSDPQAVLPANYTFTTTDAGAHTFTNGATLKTAGSQSITATDTVTSSITGKETVNVQPAAAQTLLVAGFPSPTTAGASHSFTVTAKDAYGNTATGYLGTVTFSSSDSKAVLPANYTFVANDHGKHTFNATLKTAGTQSLTATDNVTSSLTGTQAGIVVNPAAASILVVTGFPSPIAHGTPGSFTVTAEDAYGNIATGYRGTVHFTSSDAAASLPANYTFTSADGGSHTFTATLNTAGTQSITGKDTVTPTITGTQSGILVTAASIEKWFENGLFDSDDAGAILNLEDSPAAPAVVLADTADDLLLTAGSHNYLTEALFSRPGYPGDPNDEGGVSVRALAAMAGACWLVAGKDSHGHALRRSRQKKLDQPYQP